MLRMPPADAGVLARREQIIEGLRRIVPGEGVITTEDERRAYEMRRPDRLPATADGGGACRRRREQVSQVLALLPGERREGRAARLRHLAVGRRAAACGCACCSAWASSTASSTSTSPTAASWRSRASPISAITHAVQHAGFYYAPDPSSQIACSIGGNVAENSGGVHCLKYGLTTNNVLGIEMVLMNGEVVRLGGKYLDADGYDLLGVMTGSEGLLGVVTEVTVRILRKPPTARAVLLGFATSEEGGQVRRRDHRRRHHPGRHGDDGPPGDPRGRGVRPRRLSARRRGAADRRAGRRARRRSTT